VAVPPTRSWKPAENIENDLLASSYYPHVAIDSMGDVLVSWVEQAKVKVRRYDGATGTWGMIQTIEEMGSPGDSAVGIGTTGQTMVV
jgi:hypothetical protein